METNIEQKVAESQDTITENTQTESVINNVKIKDNGDKKNLNSNKKTLTPYQKYKNSRNQNGKKYFDFYDDIKVYTHNIYDW
ncbi:MAG: hypothetical protein IJ458_02375 [Clostridia bacterium]|nr:hypothetical protein [Clostridia bacterium]